MYVILPSLHLCLNLLAPNSKKHLAMGTSGRGFCDFLYNCEVWVVGSIPGRINCKRALNGAGQVSMSKFYRLEQHWLHDSQQCITSQVCLCLWYNWLHFRDLFSFPSSQCLFPFHWHIHKKPTNKCKNIVCVKLPHVLCLLDKRAFSRPYFGEKSYCKKVKN